MQYALIVLSTVLSAAAPQARATTTVAGDTVAVPSCLVTLIEDIEVPAQEGGVLTEIKVSEGDEVSDEQLLAQIDDTQATSLWKVADAKLKAAEKEAGNDISVRYAEKASKVTWAEYLQAEEANRRMPGTVPQAELRRMLLAYEQATLQIEQARHDLAIAAMMIEVRKAEMEAATEDVERRKIRARLEGKAEASPAAAAGPGQAMVVKRYRNLGEWVQPGEPVLRIVRMDRLRVEAFLDATRVSRAEVKNKQVSVTVALPGGQQMVFQGAVVFASPMTEAGAQFLVWAEVVNLKYRNSDQWLLMPGQNAQMKIHLKKPKP